MNDHRTIAPNEDPVCGMTVDIEDAIAKGLAVERDGHRHVFCGKGCMLDFLDDPHRYLASDYIPSM